MTLRDTVHAAGRKRLIVGALFTEIFLASLAVEVLRHGYGVALPLKATGTLSQVARMTAVKRLMQAAAVPTASLAIATELLFDWIPPVADKARELGKGYLTDPADAMKAQDRAA